MNEGRRKRHDVIDNTIKAKKSNQIPSKVDGYGFERSDSFDYGLNNEFTSTYKPILERRNRRWNDSVSNSKVPHNRKMKRFCRKGIPNEYRATAWMSLSKADKYMKNNPSLYQELQSQTLDLKVEESIKLDLHRTFPENIYFSDTNDTESSLQVPLYNVLKALAIKNKKIAYCQGMNFVAGLLLITVKNQEKVFWLMDTLMNEILPDFYNPDMKALKAEQELLGQIVSWKLPEVHRHLVSLGVPWMLIGTKWFICMYADVAPVETVLRIWDALFYEGSKILLRVAFTLISMNSDKILACKDFPEAVHIIQSSVKNPLVKHCHSFMELIFKETGSFPRNEITKMRKSCIEKIT
ncbi:growth hormone-regulated TBC protein 1-A isoform X2 [Octopus bimaculoides]|uniref:growth hormone-regulated TBC protein 1-A isoform X2 n=1 Tax=Octopus bimaculoides TaxID=37653 RepID=UPI00071E0B31|nr:growth hormone-regulated TBC protein 1-A isoform X2 [Octopus bimaculoides]|eukprot:XP_014773213.1 PREDICTED: growth hormone-regulated TBC protein 1-A-like isoform X2 [Octopus bimaculoides]